MDQKLFNERIAMSLLRQCAWVWEHCTKNLRDGEFGLQDILRGLGKKSHESKPGYVILDTGFCKHWDVFNQTQPIDGLTFDREEMKSRMSFPTGDGMGFCFAFPIESVFQVTLDFCRMNACQALVSKSLFIHHGKERYASLPEVRRPSAKASRPHTVRRVAKTVVAAERTLQPSLADRLRAALLARLAA